MAAHDLKQSTSSTSVICPCCDDAEVRRPPRGIGRRQFMRSATGAVIGAGAFAAAAPLGRVWAQPAATAPTTATPESLVKVLYETLSPGQREKICFKWDHQDEDRGLLRTRVSANWDITDEFLVDGFYTKDQQAVIRQIFEGIISPEWHERIDKQLSDDSGGYGEQNSIAIFGEPGTDQFEFVMTGRHMTIRCDGNSAEHVAFGGPIFYGHAGESDTEAPDHPNNVFWHQAKEANKLYQMLDGGQQEQALIRRGFPSQSRVAFKGKEGMFQGISVSVLSNDQQEHLQHVMKLLLEPYRQSDRDEVSQCLQKQGGLEACHLSYSATSDIGGDGVWDNWRIEGPSFVWHYRGAPHVHVWVNVADDPSPKLNV
jgi:hypothetical protein